MTEKDQWESVVIPVLAAALMEHGVPVEHTGHRRANGTEEMVELGRIDWHGQQLEFVIVPKLVGRFIAALLDGTASFASQCYERRASDSICSVPP